MLKIEGLTWDTSSPDKYEWNSTYSVAEGNKLYFGYEYKNKYIHGSRLHGDETAAYTLAMDCEGFTGTYDGGKSTADGKLHRQNKRFWGSSYRIPSEQEREQLAKTYMRHFMRTQEYDQDTFQRRLLSASKARRQDSFVRFVKQSNSKAAEVDLLNKAIQSLPWPSSIRSILDLGAGEGTITIEALKALKFDSKIGKYVGVDSNGILLEALSTRLKKEYKRQESNDTILIRRNIDAFLNDETDHFDVVLGCHCLYFVDNVSSVLSAIFTRMLKKGGRFASMHTDIMSPKASFIRSLIKSSNDSLKLDIVDQLKKSATAAGMRCLLEENADIILTFPHLDRHGWGRVARNGEGNEVTKVIELIAFIVDRGPEEFDDPSDWRQCAKKVQNYLRSNNDQVVFPVTMHVFEKE